MEEKHCFLYAILIIIGTSFIGMIACSYYFQINDGQKKVITLYETQKYQEQQQTKALIAKKKQTLLAKAQEKEKAEKLKENKLKEEKNKENSKKIANNKNTSIKNNQQEKKSNIQKLKTNKFIANKPHVINENSSESTSKKDNKSKTKNKKYCNKVKKYCPIPKKNNLSVNKKIYIKPKKVNTVAEKNQANKTNIVTNSRNNPNYNERYIPQENTYNMYGNNEKIYTPTVNESSSGPPVPSNSY